MAMNQQKKAAAVKKYGPLFTQEQQPSGAIRAAIKADDKAYTDEETEEILAEVMRMGADNPDKEKDQKAQGAGTAAGSAEPTPTLNKAYDEHRVDPVYEEVKDPMGKTIGSKLKGFEKGAYLRTTEITPERAEELNAQSQNTKLRLYLSTGTTAQKRQREITD